MSAFDMSAAFQAAQQAEDSPQQGDLLTSAELPDGSKVQAEVFYAKAGTTKAGAPKFNIGWTVTEEGHPHKGGKFFDGLNFSAKSSDASLSFNKGLFAKLGVLGLGEPFFSSNPSGEAIAAAIKGKSAVITMAWETSEKYGEQVSGIKTRWAPVAGGGASPSGY